MIFFLFKSIYFSFSSCLKQLIKIQFNHLNWACLQVYKREIILNKTIQQNNSEKKSKENVSEENEIQESLEEQSKEVVLNSKDDIEEESKLKENESDLEGNIFKTIDIN